jgi:signal transduction histidine kinase/CheY-like chemotaxis protein
VKLFQYAEPVRLKASCVECHNKHPESPKTDWQVGQIRGIQKVTIPYAQFSFASTWRLMVVVALVLLMTVFAASTIILLFRFLSNKNELVSLAEERAQLLKKNHQALQQSKDEVEESYRAKARFLAAMSHEIRTPLNGITGMIGLLSGDNLSASQQKDLDTIKTCSASLVQIINDILDFSKIEAGKATVSEHVFRPRDIVINNLHLFSGAAAEKGIDLKVTVDPETPEQLIGDESKINQILFNLLGNSIKFTTQGGVEVFLSGTSLSQEQYALSIKVIDTGIGIAPESMGKIFNAFEQAEHGDTRRFSGTGLGLAISQQLVALMGGSINCSSKPNRGSVFRVSLRTKKIDVFAGKHSQSEHLGQDSAAESLDESVERPRILVVEDNPVNQQVITRLLKKLGYTSELAMNGQEAVEIWREKKMDLILMDIQMPVKDGYQAAEEIRVIQETGDLPIIIALTANAGETDLQACLDKGMNDYQAKPYKEKKLKEKLLYWSHKIAVMRAHTPASESEVQGDAKQADDAA